MIDYLNNEFSTSIIHRVRENETQFCIFKIDFLESYLLAFQLKGVKSKRIPALNKLSPFQLVLFILHHL